MLMLIPNWKVKPMPAWSSKNEFLGLVLNFKVMQSAMHGLPEWHYDDSQIISNLLKKKKSKMVTTTWQAQDLSTVHKSAAENIARSIFHL